MIDLIAVAIAAFIAGYIIAPKKVVRRISGKNWSIYVEATKDPSIYRGVYEKDGRVIYSVEGHGVSRALQNLADEIGGL